jgi:hypothetical protein
MTVDSKLKFPSQGEVRNRQPCLKCGYRGCGLIGPQLLGDYVRSNLKGADIVYPVLLFIDLSIEEFDMTPTKV